MEYNEWEMLNKNPNFSSTWHKNRQVQSNEPSSKALQIGARILVLLAILIVLSLLSIIVGGAWWILTGSPMFG